MTRPGIARLLIAGMGNVLRGDDGFGVAVAEAAAERDWSDDDLRVEVVEVGIGGLHLVQQLQEGYDGLVIVDAVDRGAEPGRLFVLEPSVPDPRDLPPEERRPVVAETHQTVPARVLLMARALDALPPNVRILGCQPASVEALGMELSPEVTGAIPRAVGELEGLVETFRARRCFDGSGRDRRAGAASGAVRPGRTTE